MILRWASSGSQDNIEERKRGVTKDNAYAYVMTITTDKNDNYPWRQMNRIMLPIMNSKMVYRRRQRTHKALQPQKQSLYTSFREKHSTPDVLYCRRKGNDDNRLSENAIIQSNKRWVARARITRTMTKTNTTWKASKGYNSIYDDEKVMR